MSGLSKSRYVMFRQCEKSLWLEAYKKNVKKIDDSRKSVFENGQRVGDIAKGLFSPSVDVTTYKQNNAEDKDLVAMVAKTKEEMKKGTPVICEASFFFEDNYCAVDILRKTEDGWAIYEVKSVTDINSSKKRDQLMEFTWDISYQKWLLEQNDVNVTGTYLVYLDNTYIRQGELDLQKLFIIKDMADIVSEELPKVKDLVDRAMKVLANPEEPEQELSRVCEKPYKCMFWDYCTRNLPKPSVFDVYGGKFGSKKADQFYFPSKLSLYQDGKVSFDDIKDKLLGRIQRMQVECTLDGTEYIDHEGIRSFIDTLSYPLYFLDFETMNDPIPQYDGTKSYQQVPFQYSLHIQESETSGYIHKEFLAPSDGRDPRRALAEQLCRDIPMDVCTLAYNKQFECERLKELANIFPDLAKNLLNIRDNVKDLIDPFEAGYYYVPAIGGSFSIKSVLPALFPNDPSLDYHNLTGGVQNGNDAMTIFPKIKDMSPKDAKEAREALLRYCELDTWAMVKVLEKLKNII